MAKTPKTNLSLKAGAKLSPEQRAEAYKMCLRGYSIRAVAAKYNIAPESVQELVSRMRTELGADLYRTRTEILAELADFRRLCYEKTMEVDSKPVESSTTDEVWEQVKTKSGRARQALIKKTIRKYKAQRTGEAIWMQLVLMAVKMEMEILGIQNLSDQDGQELRYAGADVESINDSMVDRLAKLIAARRGSLEQKGYIKPIETTFSAPTATTTTTTTTTKPGGKKNGSRPKPITPGSPPAGGNEGTGNAEVRPKPHGHGSNGKRNGKPSQHPKLPDDGA